MIGLCSLISIVARRTTQIRRPGQCFSRYVFDRRKGYILFVFMYFAGFDGRPIGYIGLYFCSNMDCAISVYGDCYCYVPIARARLAYIHGWPEVVVAPRIIVPNWPLNVGLCKMEWTNIKYKCNKKSWSCENLRSSYYRGIGYT